MNLETRYYQKRKEVMLQLRCQSLLSSIEQLPYQKTLHMYVFNSPKRHFVADEKYNMFYKSFRSDEDIAVMEKEYKTIEDVIIAGMQDRAFLFLTLYTPFSVVSDETETSKLEKTYGIFLQGDTWKPLPINECKEYHTILFPENKNKYCLFPYTCSM